MLSIQVLEGRTSLETLAPEWESLVGDSFSAVFSNPAWRLAWTEVFEPADVTVVTAREEGRLVGVLPLCRIRTDSRGLYFRQVTTLGCGDYQSFVIAPELADVVLPGMLDAAIRHFGKHGVYWWPNIPATDPSLELLRGYFRSHRMPWVEATEIGPRLRLDGRDFEAVEQALNPSHRKDVRRQRKRLAAEKGPLSLWQPSSIEEAEPVLSEFFRVHDEKWLSQGQPGMFQSPGQQRHFRAMLRHLWGKGLHFSTVRCGDVDVSYHFGYSSGKWLQWYRPSYRTEFGVYSPSKIHVAMLIEEACRQQWNGVDFLLGEEPYKFMWANETVQVVSVNAGFHDWAPSYFWFSRGKPYVRSKLAWQYAQAKAWLQKMNNPDR
jgi:CelD/BcsL family acetyltransferase involved in cellulose biosynthesis